MANLSTLTSIAGVLIPERSEATPGLFNRVFSQLSQNLDQVNAVAGIDGRVYVNPLSYGAAGDGVADDTAALQTAINVAQSSTTRPSSVIIPAGIFNYTVLSATSAIIMRGVGASQSILQCTSNNTGSISFNYPNTGVGLDGNRWGAGLQDLGIWRSGLPLNGTALLLGGSNGAQGFYANNVRFVGFGTELSIASNAALINFNNCEFDACFQHVITQTGAQNAGENVAFMHCVFANGQNQPNSILWQTGGFNGEFIACSFDGVQFAINNGTAHLTNCHMENVGDNGQRSHISMGGGYLDLVNLELYVNPASTFTAAAPIVISAGTCTALGSVASSNTLLASLFSVGAAGALYEFGTKQAFNFTNLVTATGTVGAVNNVASQNSFVGTSSFLGKALFPVGSSTSPSVAFGSEASLGFYRSAASTIAQSYGTLLLAPNLGDKVGIGLGAQTPLDVLDVRGNGVGRNGVGINNTTAGVGNSAHLFLAADAGAGNLTLEMYSSTYGGTPNQGWLFTGGASTPLILATQGTERFRVQSGGSLVAAQPIFYQSGSAVAPQVGFASELSLGWYRSAASVMALSYGGLGIKAGTNNSCGTAVLGSNGSVNVTNSYVTTGDLIFLTDQSPGGTLGDLEVGGIRAGSGFTIQSTSVTDTSTVAWLIVRPG